MEALPPEKVVYDFSRVRVIGFGYNDYTAASTV